MSRVESYDPETRRKIRTYYCDSCGSCVTYRETQHGCHTCIEREGEEYDQAQRAKRERAMEPKG